MTLPSSMVKAALTVAVLVACTSSGRKETERQAVTHYVQLIRASYEEKPPLPGVPPAGPRLANALHSVFDWRMLWQMAQKQVALTPGHVTRVRLSGDCEVELGITKHNERSITSFYGGQEVQRIVCPMADAMTVLGGRRDRHSAWFIVVRRDRPGS